MPNLRFLFAIALPCTLLLACAPATNGEPDAGPDAGDAPDASDLDAGNPDAARACAIVSNRAVRESVHWFAGDGGTCDPGTLSPTAREDALLFLNSARELHGLDPVTLDATAAADEQACANLVVRAGTVQHSYDPSTTCFTEAANAALGQSLVAQGTGHPATAIDPLLGAKDAFAFYRRWLLNPGAGTTAFGWFDGTTCVRAFSIGSNSPTRGFVAWPSPGAFPRHLAPTTWTFHPITQGGDATSMRVEDGDGQLLATGEHRGAGLGVADVWQADVGARPAGTYTVRLGESAADAYSVTLVDCP